jgi:hypothetical protein
MNRLLEAVTLNFAVADGNLFCAPCMTNADLGSVVNRGPAFVAGEGAPHALIVVPVGAHTDPGHAAPADKCSGDLR